MLSQQLEGRFLFWSTLPRGHVANNIHCIQTKRCKHSSILFHSEAYCSQTMLYFLCLFLYVTFTPDVENKEKRERLTRRKGERCKCVGRRTTGLLKKKCIKSKITDNEGGSSKQHALYSVPVIQVQMPEYIHDVAWFTTTRSDCTISIITTKQNTNITVTLMASLFWYGDLASEPSMLPDCRVYIPWLPVKSARNNIALLQPEDESEVLKFVAFFLARFEFLITCLHP
jgi:hypothetical protein